MPPLDPIATTTVVIGLAVAWTLTIIAAKNWRGDRYLCDDCIFNKPEACNKAERPKAIACTVYRSEKFDAYRM